MGLDQYVYAERHFDPEDPLTLEMLDLAQVSLEDLQKRAAQDPMEHETALYLSRWDFGKAAEQERAEAIVEKAGLTPLGCEGSKGSHIGYAPDADHVFVNLVAIYWRKANAVHGWFVDRCQGGVDECQVTPLEITQLKSLAVECQKALVGDPKVLEPRPGFFFGNYDRDEWWKKDLEWTISEIERVTRLAAEIGGVTFAYQSSW